MIKKIKSKLIYYKARKILRKIHRQLYLVKNNTFEIIFITNPHEIIQLCAVENDPWILMYIKNPTQKVIHRAVEKDSATIQFVKDPSAELQLKALNTKQYIFIIVEHIINCVESPSAEVFITLIENYLPMISSGLVKEIIDKLSKANDDTKISIIRHNINYIKYINPKSTKVLEVYNVLKTMKDACS